MSTESFEVTAFYKFIKIPSERVPVVRKELESFAERTGLRGLVVLRYGRYQLNVRGNPRSDSGAESLFERAFPG